ncbi:hypothetical protein JCM6882_002272, partial [Rhodosporidiobolus microsporus]
PPPPPPPTLTLALHPLPSSVRNTWHRPRDWNNLDPESMKLPHSPELFGHDATAHTVAHYAEAAERVKAKFAGEGGMKNAGAGEEGREAAEMRKLGGAAPVPVPITA